MELKFNPWWLALAALTLVLLTLRSVDMPAPAQTAAPAAQGEARTPR